MYVNDSIMNWTQTTTCTLWILLYKREWPNHPFLYHSLLPFCIKGCACILKSVTPGTPFCRTTIKPNSSACWLILEHWVKGPCLRHSHTTQCFHVVLFTRFTPAVSAAQGDSAQFPVKAHHQLDQRCSTVIPEQLRQVHSYARDETSLFDRRDRL